MTDLGFKPFVDVDGSIDWNITNPNQLYDVMSAQQAEYNKHIEEREDSAVQRWVADVRKAGLNPLAFSGSGASTSTLTSPHKNAFDSMMSYLNFDLSKVGLRDRAVLGAVKIGAGLASSIIGALA